MLKAVGNCPVCKNSLTISRLTCPSCNTSIEGSFGYGIFSDLTDDERNFVEIFVISRGNIKEIEKQLGISYPTVRNKLDTVVAKLEKSLQKTDPELKKARRLEVLESIKKGEISAEEGALLLEEI